MAGIRRVSKKASEQPKQQLFCRDCAHSYDWHEKNVTTGEPFMCYCPFSKWAKFLDHDYCDKLKKRT